MGVKYSLIYTLLGPSPLLQTGTAEWREALTFPPRENMKNFDLRLTDKRLSDVQLEEGN